LKALSPDIELCSIRRGGLCNLAKTLTLTEIRESFSKHASEAMLMRYLENGRVLAHLGELRHRSAPTTAAQPQPSQKWIM
jgi:hypothetical protein